MNGFPLHLMRHGATDRPGRLLGHTDDPVTDAGIAACAAQAADLAGVTVICSDLQRALRCAAAIGVPRADPRWRELDFGGWDGAVPASLDQVAYHRFWADPDADPPPDGERWSALVTRVGNAIEALPMAPVLVVTHGGAMRAALSYLCGLDRLATWAFTLPYASLLTIAVNDGVRRRGQIVGLRG